MNTPWFDPKLLDKAQTEARSQDAGSLQTNNDFGSYAVANRGHGLSYSNISSHNLISALPRIRQYAEVIGSASFKKIADMGCGLGITTNALKEYYSDAEVSGFEVSSDAVEFASRNFPKAKFTQLAIEASSEFNQKFDLILCQEFYPFTRTGDIEYHRGFIDCFLRHLAKGGVLLIELSERDYTKSILPNLGQLKLPIEIHTLAFDRVYRYIPYFYPAKLCSIILHKILGTDLNKAIVIRKD